MSLKLKDTLVDSFRNKGAERPSVEKFRPNILIKNKIVSSNGPLQAQIHVDYLESPYPIVVTECQDMRLLCERT